MMNVWRRLLLAAALALVSAPAAVSAQDAAVREITQISGGLYQFRNNNHLAVFLVTPEGIIATDPINADAARWLKAEFKRSFDQPVRYLIYSHGHADHVSGGEVFADTAVVVAHERCQALLTRDNVPTAMPQVTVKDSMTLELGGKTVELRYLGRNHTDNMLVMRFPAERAVFAVDFVPVHRLFYMDFPDGYLDEWPDSLRALEAMDFDILIPGHGRLGGKSNVTEDIEYLHALRTTVLGAFASGLTIEDIVDKQRLEAYKDWERYDEWRGPNLRGMARHLRATR
jgi:glyoxylase-like metal-dependent hydrolase (beta-lactamase superfamily II)